MHHPSIIQVNCTPYKLAEMMGRGNGSPHDAEINEADCTIRQDHEITRMRVSLKEVIYKVLPHEVTNEGMRYRGRIERKRSGIILPHKVGYRPPFDKRFDDDARARKFFVDTRHHNMFL